VRSTALGGEILTRLDQNGDKSSTYVPAEGLLFATQEKDYLGGPYVRWTQRDPLGITETGKGIYDPLGTYIPFQQHNDPRPPAGSYNSSSMSGMAASMAANPFGSDTGCLMDGLPTACSRVLRAINNGQGDKVTVSGFSSSLQLTLFMARYSAVTTTGSHYRLPPTTTYTDDDGKSYTAYGQASQAAVQFVIIPGFQLSFEPNPQNSAQQKAWYVDQNVLKDCLSRKFGVELRKFDETRAGHDGSFTGFGPNVVDHPVMNGNDSEYTILNDVHLYSLDKLKTLAINSGHQVGEKDRITGMTFNENSMIRHNYTGSDNSALEMIKTQVHELGHSLDYLTGIRLGDRHDAETDPRKKRGIEAGFVLEDCVTAGHGWVYK
jgi:hypothetical protein